MQEPVDGTSVEASTVEGEIASAGTVLDDLAIKGLLTPEDLLGAEGSAALDDFTATGKGEAEQLREQAERLRRGEIETVIAWLEAQAKEIDEALAALNAELAQTPLHLVKEA